MSRTHTRWLVQIAAGETREARNGTRITNTGERPIKVLIEVPITLQNGTIDENESNTRSPNP